MPSMGGHRLLADIDEQGIAALVANADAPRSPPSCAISAARSAAPATPRSASSTAASRCSPSASRPTRAHAALERLTGALAPWDAGSAYLVVAQRRRRPPAGSSIPNALAPSARRMAGRPVRTRPRGHGVGGLDDDLRGRAGGQRGGEVLDAAQARMVAVDGDRRRRPMPRQRAPARPTSPHRSRCWASSAWRVRPSRRASVSSSRTSSNGSSTRFSSVPIASGTPASRYCRAGGKPSPRLPSVVGQETTVVPDSREQLDVGSVTWMPWTTLAQRAEEADAVEQLDRRAAVLGVALLELARLLGGVDVADDVALLAVLRDRLQPVGRHGADRVRGDAVAERVDALEERADVGVAEAPLARLGRPVEAGARGRRRAAARSAGRRRAAARRPRAPSRSGPRTACRPAGGGRSGTRPPRRSRPRASRA